VYRHTQCTVCRQYGTRYRISSDGQGLSVFISSKLGGWVCRVTKIYKTAPACTNGHANMLFLIFFFLFLFLFLSSTETITRAKCAREELAVGTHALFARRRLTIAGRTPLCRSSTWAERKCMRGWFVGWRSVEWIICGLSVIV
jgi:hypothetical protein